MALVAKSGADLQNMLDSKKPKHMHMVFSGGRLDSGVQLTYKGFKLELVDNFRYLGVIFSRSFSFNLCVDTLTKVDRKQ